MPSTHDGEQPQQSGPENRLVLSDIKHRLLASWLALCTSPCAQQQRLMLMLRCALSAAVEGELHRGSVDETRQPAANGHVATEELLNPNPVATEGLGAHHHVDASSHGDEGGRHCSAVHWTPSTQDPGNLHALQCRSWQRRPHGHF